MDKRNKVFFVQEIGNKAFETESIWCDRIGDNKFIIDNISFVAKRISLGDIISAELDIEDNQYYFDDFISTSGNTTVRIYIYDEKEIEETRNWLKKNGCESEVFLARNIIAINIPKNIIYSPIKLYLDEGEEKGRWTYEESCLEHDY